METKLKYKSLYFWFSSPPAVFCLYTWHCYIVILTTKQRKMVSIILVKRMSSRRWVDAWVDSPVPDGLLPVLEKTAAVFRDAVTYHKDLSSKLLIDLKLS